MSGSAAILYYVGVVIENRRQDLGTVGSEQVDNEKIEDVIPFRYYT